MGVTEDNGQAVRRAFEHWEGGDSRPFFALVDREVRWTVIGSTPISGTYESKRVFLTATARLTERFATPLTARIIDVSATGDKVFLQWEGTAVSTTGLDYHQSYCWVLTLRGGRIVEVIAYLDTELVSAVLAPS